eukprot:scaffold2821_cov240-Pinguiococcus_pyrenoidosus.AAC.1
MSGAQDLSLLDDIDLDAKREKSSRARSKPKAKKRPKRRRLPSEPQSHTIEDILAENQKKLEERISAQLDVESEFPSFEDFEDYESEAKPREAPQQSVLTEEPEEPSEPAEPSEPYEPSKQVDDAAATAQTAKANEEVQDSSMEEFLKTLEILSRERVPELGPPKDLDEIIAETNETVARALEDEKRREAEPSPAEPAADAIEESDAAVGDFSGDAFANADPAADAFPQPAIPTFGRLENLEEKERDQMLSPPPSPPRSPPPPSSGQQSISITAPAVSEQLANVFQDEPVVSAQEALDAISALHDRLEVHVASHPEEDHSEEAG